MNSGPRGISQKISHRLSAFTAFLTNNPYKTLLFVLVFTMTLLSALPTLKVETSTEAFFHEEDPVLLNYREFQKQFGREDAIIIAIASKEIFAFPFLEKLRAFHQALEKEVPHLSDISSLINARSTRGEAEELVVEELLENWPGTEEELALIKGRALANPLYRNTLLSEDGLYTAVILEPDSFSSSDGKSGEEGFEDFGHRKGFDSPGDSSSEGGKREEPLPLTDLESNAMVDAVKKVIGDHNGPDFTLHMAGSPIVDYSVKAQMQEDMGKFMVLSIGAIGVFLFLLFRRLGGVLLPLVVVILSLLATMAAMALAGAAIKVPTQILPSFILAVGVGDAVHLLTLFFRHLNEGDDQATAVEKAVGHSGLAMIMTSLTTAGGLLSFTTSHISPVADLGLFAPLGVLLALFYTLVLLPPLVVLLPFKGRTPKDEAKGGAPPLLDRVIDNLARFSVEKPWLILGLALPLIFIALAGTSRLFFAYDPLTWLPEEAPVLQATEIIDRELKGTVSLEVIIDTRQENGWHDATRLNSLDELTEELKQYREGRIFVGQAVSLVDTLKEIHQALNENQPGFRTVPQERELIAQEFLLFENSGSEDLEDLTDSQFSLARLSLKLPALDALEYTRFIEWTEKISKEKFGEEVEITITGIAALLFRTVTAMIISMAQSYMIAFAIITLLMVLLLGSIRTGILSLIPNLFPILLTLGIMGWFAFPLDAFTLLIGSIAIGLVVDDTIHFMNNYQIAVDKGLSPAEAVRQTLSTTGRAILFTSLVLSTGFFIYMFSSMKNLANFGLLTGLTILFALAAEFLLTPALMVLFARKRETSDFKSQISNGESKI